MQILIHTKQLVIAALQPLSEDAVLDHRRSSCEVPGGRVHHLSDLDPRVGRGDKDGDQGVGIVCDYLQVVPGNLVLHRQSGNQQPGVRRPQLGVCEQRRIAMHLGMLAAVAAAGRGVTVHGGC